MKLIDKLKNVFFEEVEEEEEEKPQTFAKKVEIPKKKKSFIKFDNEEKKLNNFLEEDEEKKEDNKIIEEDNKETFIEVEEEQDNSKVVPMMFDEDDFQEDKNIFEEKEAPKEVVYKRENRNDNLDNKLYSTKREYYEDNINRNTSYTYNKASYHDEKEVKGFKPSPIISPIYGILDKNYRKEEVVTKRETRISTSYSKPDLDTIRNKAFKEVNDEKTKPQKDNKYEDNKRVYDVNNNKPHVNKVTLADADEYYNDLGLAYNVDYSDASRNNDTRNLKYSSHNKKKNSKDVDDNLFDLIDSMYNKED